MLDEMLLAGELQEPSKKVSLESCAVLFASHQRHGMAQHMQGSVSHTCGLLFDVICIAACT